MTTAIPVKVTPGRTALSTPSLRNNLVQTVNRNNFISVKLQQHCTTNSLRAAVLNTRSTCELDKCQQIQDLKIENQLDICSLTETWFKPSHIAVKVVVPPGYTMKHIPRANARGGGVAIIFRDSTSVTVSTHNTCTSMEYLNCLFKVGLELLRIVTIYRPPPKEKSPNVPVFLNEFADLLEDLTLTSDQLLLVGDLNFHFDNPTSAHTKPIIDLLSATNHQQHVTLATHQKGHILDVIITRRDELPIADITCDESVNSDHSAVIFTVPTTHTVQPKRTITVRKLKNVNTQQISHDIACSDLITQQAYASAAEAFSCYNFKLLSILDQHAPARKCNITVKNNVPWYNADIKAAKAETEAAGTSVQEDTTNCTPRYVYMSKKQSEHHVR